MSRLCSLTRSPDTSGGADCPTRARSVRAGHKPVTLNMEVKMFSLRIMSSLLLFLFLSGTAGAQDASDAPADEPRLPRTRISAAGQPASRGDAETDARARTKHIRPASAKTQPGPAGADTDQAPAEQIPELSPEAQARRDELRRCLAYYFLRPETTAERAPWARCTRSWVSASTRPRDRPGKVNAIGWLCWNRPCGGQQLFYADRGQVIAPIGPGYQGHEGQFLQIMALSPRAERLRMKVNGQEFSIADLVKREQWTCQSGTELSFKLVGLAHYLDSDATWQNQFGESWNLERVIQEELAQPVNNNVACGGTHRLMGLGYAVRKRERRGEPLTGQWARAKQTVDHYAAYAFQCPEQRWQLQHELVRRSRQFGRPRAEAEHHGTHARMAVALLARRAIERSTLGAGRPVPDVVDVDLSRSTLVYRCQRACVARLDALRRTGFRRQPGQRNTELARFADQVTADGPPLSRVASAVPPAAGRARGFRVR